MRNPKITDLIAAAARATGVRQQSTWQCARILREAGLIRHHGRGRSAADMAPADAANLLLGLMASDAWPEAPANVRLAREATPQHVKINGSFQDAPVALPVPFLYDESGQPRTFGDAIEALIAEMVAEGDPVGNYGLPIENLFIGVDRPGTSGLIEIVGENDFAISYRREDPRLDGITGDAWNKRRVELAQEPGMSVRATIGFESLWTLADCLIDQEARAAAEAEGAAP